MIVCSNDVLNLECCPIEPDRFFMHKAMHMASPSYMYQMCVSEAQYVNQQDFKVNCCAKLTQALFCRTGS